MAQSGFTPISLYYSTTASAVPTSGNLVAGELALNTIDEKLYFKNSAGTVKLLAANITPVANGGTGLSSTPSNGQLDIGNGTGFTRATITAGSGISVTNGSGSITIANTATVAAATPTALGTVFGLTASATIPTFLGYEAGLGNTGNQTTAVGYQALKASNSGQFNTAFGWTALRDNTSGSSNVALGPQTLTLNTTGSRNIAIGNSALYPNTTASDNVAIGNQALQTNSTGANNTAVGSSALYANTTASNNTAVGYFALDANTTGASNVALGSNALGLLTTGSQNVSVGSSSLQSATGAATSNTAVGFGALSGVTTSSGNVGIGEYTGFNLTTGANNTIVGTSFTSASLATGSNNILLGYNANASSSSVSNENTFGNSSTTSNRFWGDMKMGGSSAGTAGQVLTSAGAGASPTWATAGGSAGSVTAVASGSLSNGSMVILNSDGTVSVPVATAADTFQNTSSGTSTVVTGYDASDTNYRNISACFNPSTGTVVVFYISNSNFFLNAVAGTVNKGAITFGTPTRIYTGSVQVGASNGGIHAAYNSIDNFYICLFRGNASEYGSYSVCRTSGTSITSIASYPDSWGSSNDFPAGFTLIFSPTLNGGNSQALIYYNASSPGTSYVIACVGSSGGNMTIGTRYDLGAGVGTTQMLGCFATASNIAYVPYRGPSGTVYLAIVTLSGTSATLSFQGQMSSNSISGFPISVAYSSVQDKFMGAWMVSGDTRGAIFTVSGTTPTFGATASISGLGSATKNINLVADVATGFFWAGHSNYLNLITVSGTTFTSGSVNSFISSVSSANNGNVIYDSVNLAFLQPNLSNPISVSYAQGFTSTINSSNFLGVSNAAYTNGQTATIQTVGSTDDAQSGLTIGSKYYVLPSGALSVTAFTQPYAGLALTATKLVVKG